MPRRIGGGGQQLREGGRLAGREGLAQQRGGDQRPLLLELQVDNLVPAHGGGGRLDGGRGQVYGGRLAHVGVVGGGRRVACGG